MSTRITVEVLEDPDDPDPAEAPDCAIPATLDTTVRLVGKIVPVGNAANLGNLILDPDITSKESTVVSDENSTLKTPERVILVITFISDVATNDCKLGAVIEREFNSVTLGISKVVRDEQFTSSDE